MNRLALWCVGLSFAAQTALAGTPAAAPASPEAQAASAATPDPTAPVTARAPAPASQACAAISADLAAARAAGKLKEAVALYAKAGGTGAGCEPKALFCLGRSLALAHLEAAYQAAAAPAEKAGGLLEAGRHYGEPWPLLVGLGDAANARARATHDPRLWSEASVAYQQAVAAVDDPALCEGEPPRPDPQAFDVVVRKMSLATLLAKPLTFFHSKCAPCSLAFLAHGPIAADHPRPLPITFEDDSAQLTPEGTATTKALADCALAQAWSKLVLSVHADARGSEGVNQALSRQRVESLTRLLRADGFAGTLEAEAKGKAEPLRVDDARGLSDAEVQRANRRVELRSVEGGTPAPQCAASEAPAP